MDMGLSADRRTASTVVVTLVFFDISLLFLICV